MVRSVLAAFGAAALLCSLPARADETACLDAASKGQRDRDTHKLVEAREQFRLCAAAECPSFVQSDCAGWLGAVERALPSVVVTARDENGSSVIDVAVSVDGRPFATRLAGEALPIDPGVHTFRIERAGYAVIELVEVVPEGEQNHRVSVVLRPLPAPAPSPGPEPQAAAKEPIVGAASPGATERSHGAPAVRWQTVGWAVGGLGVAGLVVGTVAGVVAIEDKHRAACVDQGGYNLCYSGPLSDAHHAANVSTAGFIAGGILTAGGIGLVIFGAKQGHAKSEGAASSGASAVVSPVLNARAPGIAVGGTW